MDKNPFAVEIARLSLGLVTRSKDLPFTFVDHALREGDAVIGLHLSQIESMTKIWNRLLDPDEQDLGIERFHELRDAMDRAVLDAYGPRDRQPDDTQGIAKRLRKLDAERAAEEQRRG